MLAHSRRAAIYSRFEGWWQGVGVGEEEPTIMCNAQLSAAHADATSESPSLDVLCTNHSADASNADDSVNSAPLSSAVMAVDNSRY